MVEIRIVVGADGQVTVTAPFGNKAACYGLLELAKDVVRAHGEAAEHRIQPPPPDAVARFTKQ